MELFFCVSVFQFFRHFAILCPSFSKGSLVRPYKHLFAFPGGVARPEATNGVQAEAFNFTRISTFINSIGTLLTSARLCPMVWKIRAS